MDGTLFTASHYEGIQTYARELLAFPRAADRERPDVFHGLIHQCPRPARTCRTVVMVPDVFSRAFPFTKLLESPALRDDRRAPGLRRPARHSREWCAKGAQAVCRQVLGRA